MPTVHRTLTGAWGKCLRPESCSELFHLPNMTVKQANRMPLAMLQVLLEAVDPPSMNAGGIKRWHDDDGQYHRDYDLPAMVTVQGEQYWFQHGLSHRGSDRPAVVFADGHREWHASGNRHRAGDKPAIIRADGREEWWHRGMLHRVKGPARIWPDGSVEYWMYGTQLGVAD